MSSRKKIIIFVVSISAGLLVFLYALLLLILSNNFNYLEKDTVGIRLKRINSDSGMLFNSFKSKSFDWGEWTNSYDFLIGQNNSFLAENLNDTALKNLDLNAIIFVDKQGKIAGSYAYDSLAQKEDASFLGLFQEKMADLYFRDYFMSADYQQGIILFPGNRPPLYLVSKQVLRSDKSGPAAGYVFMGRFLDKNFVDYYFKDVALYSTIIERVDYSDLPADFFDARNKLIMKNEFVVVPAGPDNIYGYSLFNDYLNNPAFIFRIETDRTLFHYGNNLLLYISALMLVAFITFLFFFLWMINRLFLNRLLLLFNKIDKYKKNPSLNNIDILIPGKDELAKLSEDFNDLVAEISDSRNFYKNLLIGLPDIVALIKDGRVIYVNDAFELKTGFRKEDALGSNLIDFIDENDRALVLENMKSRLSGGVVLSYTIKILTKKEPLDVRVGAKIIDYQGAKVDLVVLTDISDSIKINTKLMEKAEELERLNKMMINRELKMVDLKRQIAKSKDK